MKFNIGCQEEGLWGTRVRGTGHLVDKEVPWWSSSVERWITLRLGRYRKLLVVLRMDLEPVPRSARWAAPWPPNSLSSELSYNSPPAAYNSSCWRNHALLWQSKGWASAELLGVHYGQHLDSRQLLGVLHLSHVATFPWTLTTAPAEGSDLEEHPAD